jgi:hypothetical protein
VVWLSCIALLVGACGESHASTGGDSGIVIDATADVVIDAAASSAVLSVTPLVHDFGTVEIGRGSAPQTFTVENVGSARSEALSASLDGIDATQFSILSDDCTARLAPGETCTVDVAYAPTTRSMHQAELRVDGGDAMTTVALHGDARIFEPPPLMPATQDFGTVTLGSMSSAVAFTLTNYGSVPIGPWRATTGGTDASEFVVLANECSVPVPGGASCTIDVVFRPASPAGAKSATLDVTDDVVTATATLTGTAATGECFDIMPSAYDFGSSPVGTSTATMEFTVDPVPSIPLSIALGGANPSDFIISSDACGGTIGGSCAISIAFEPTTTGARSAELRVQGMCTATAALTGTGT